MKRILTAVICIAAIAGCHGGITTEDVMSDSTPRLVVSGVVAFTFDEQNCQETFNAVRHEYGAMTDNASDFYALKLEQWPSEVGETIRGELRWTTKSGTREMKNVTFKVMKLEGDTFWLNSLVGNVNVVGRILE